MHVALQKSVATRLLRVVFGLYLLVAIIVTIVQMVFEYRYVGDQVKAEISNINKSYARSIASSVWTFNTSQINSILIGIHEIASVVGVSIIDDSKHYHIGLIRSASGDVVTYGKNQKRQSQVTTINSDELLEYKFPIIYAQGDKQQSLGKLIVYSSRAYIFDQVKYGFFLIIVNSVVKTIALWIIFVYFLRRIISRPLAQLTQATDQLNLEKLPEAPLSIDAKEQDELNLLQHAYNSMVQKLRASKEEIDTINRELEVKVVERTRDLQQEMIDRISAQKQAENANQMKSMFLANMSHEIRTPLTSMLGMARILEHMEQDEDKKDKMQLIVRNGDRLLAVVNDILDYTKLETELVKLDRKPFDIRKCLSGNIDLLSIQVKQNNNQIELQVDDEVPVLCISDEIRLNQILINLIGNAVKFTRDGTINIKASIYGAGEKLLITILDTGIGIEEAEKDKVFDVFVQGDGSTSRQYGGTGLGLAICRQFVNLMGGEIWFNSEPGVGSTFYFTIDISPQQEPVQDVSSA